MYTYDGHYIGSLDAIPEGCQLLLVSEKSPPEEKEDGQDEAASPGLKSENKSKKSKKANEVLQAEQPVAVGLKNNIYDFQTEGALMRHKIKRVEESIFTKKKEWINANTQTWIENTPFIYNYHKEADKKLHTVRPNQTFVSVKRAN